MNDSSPSHPAALQLLHRHATALNLGDEALCRAIENLLPEDNRITELVNEPYTGWRPAAPRHNTALPEYYATRAQFARLLKHLRTADALLVGGGDLILGYPQHYLLLHTCRILRVPVFHVGVGVNMRGATSTALAWSRRELPHCAHYWVRDTRSAQELRRLGVHTANLSEVPDLVYSLDVEALVAQARPFPAPWATQLKPKYLVVSIREPEGNSARWGEMQYRELAQALDELHSQRGLQLVFLPFLSAARDALRRHTGPSRHDEAVAQQIIGYLRHPEAALLAAGDLDTPQALRLLAGAQLTIGARLHSLIFSSVVHTPFIALSYNLKTESFMREIGAPELALPLDQLRATQLTQTALRLLDEHAARRAQLAELHAARRTAAFRYRELTGHLVPRSARPGATALLRAWWGWLCFRLSLKYRG
jgi:polysaccharide pyruvyl transferase WcaK-like protein